MTTPEQSTPEPQDISVEAQQVEQPPASSQASGSTENPSAPGFAPRPAGGAPGFVAPGAPNAPGFAPRPAGGAPRPAAAGGFRPGGPPRPGGGGYRPNTGGRPAGGAAGGRPRGRYAPRRRVCTFCVEHAKTIDYKDVERLRRFISDRAKIEPTRKTGVCAKHQRLLTTAIKRARHIALLPFVPNPSIGTGPRR